MTTQTKNTLKTFVAAHLGNLKAAIAYIYNKAVVIALLAYGAHQYRHLVESPAVREHGATFLEVYYGCLFIGCVAVLAPFMRLLVFPEASRFAESGKLNKQLYGPISSASVLTPGLVHYWIATVMCYAITTLIMFSAMDLGR